MNPKKNRINTLVQQTPTIVGVLAVGASLGFADHAEAGLIVKNIDQAVVIGGSLLFDLDGDMTNDFLIDVFLQKGSEVASFEGIQTAAVPTNTIGGALVGGFAIKLSEGDSVNNSFFDGSSGVARSFVDGYNDNTGPWGAIGAHGFLPLRIESNGANFFGWVELTRGSLTLGQVGFEDTPNTAALIPTTPTVPSPGSLALLASGAIGLLGMRRRKYPVTETTLN